MRKKFKKIIAYSLTTLLLSSQTAMAYNVGENSNDSEKLAYYILNNLDDFSDSYNSQAVQNGSGTFNPVYCEYRISINILDSGEKAVYIDFDGNNGYMVVSEDEIVKFEPLGDLDYIRSFRGEIYYSTADEKFVYYKNNELLYLGDTEMNRNLLEAVSDKDYAGTNDGIITDLDKYINDRYGKLSLYECRMLDNSKLYGENADNYFDQFETSVYTYYDSKAKKTYSEGNCVLVATHNALTYLKIKGKIKGFPLYTTFTALISPTVDTFYDQAIMYGYSAKTLKTSALYFDIRQIAIEDYGYTISNSTLPDGSNNNKAISTRDMPNFISKIANRYKQTINASLDGAWMSQITSNIQQDYPTILTLANDPVYGNHDVVITGYSIYKKYATVLGVKVCTQTVNTIRIMNGWSKNVCFFDVSASYSLGNIVQFV